MIYNNVIKLVYEMKSIENISDINLLYETICLDMLLKCETKLICLQ
jgi:hypothetical protein